MKYNEDKIINYILNYESPTHFNEINRCLEDMTYVINENNNEAYNNILIKLDNNNIDLIGILNNYKCNDFSNINILFESLFNNIIESNNHDRILDLFNNKFTEVNLNFFLSKMKLSIKSDDYVSKRIPNLLKMLKLNDNKIILFGIIDAYIVSNGLNDIEKLSDFKSIIDDSDVLIIKEKSNDILKCLLNCNYNKNSLIIIDKFKECMSIDDIKSLFLLTINNIEKNNYENFFSIFSYHIDEILKDIILKIELENFLINNLRFSDNLNKTITFFKQNFYTINNIEKLFEYYLDSPFAEKDDILISNTIADYINDGSQDIDPMVLKNILDTNDLSAIKIEKCCSIFKDIDYVEITNQLCKSSSFTFYSNMVKILIYLNNPEECIEYIDSWGSNVEFLKKALKSLYDSDLNLSKELKFKLNEILNSAREYISDDSFCFMCNEISKKYHLFHLMNKIKETV